MLVVNDEVVRIESLVVARVTRATFVVKHCDENHTRSTLNTSSGHWAALGLHDPEGGKTGTSASAAATLIMERIT